MRRDVRHRLSAEFVDIVMRARRAQAAAHFDRAVAVGQRHAVDGEQRRARRDAQDARARRVGGDRATAVPAPSACARRTASRKSRTSSRDRRRSGRVVRPRNSAAGSVISSSTTGSPPYSSTRRRTSTGSPGFKSSRRADIGARLAALDVEQAARRIFVVRRRCGGCAGSGSSTPAPRCAWRRTCPCPAAARRDCRRPARRSPCARCPATRRSARRARFRTGSPAPGAHSRASRLFSSSALICRYSGWNDGCGGGAWRRGAIGSACRSSDGTALSTAVVVCLSHVLYLI